MKKAIADFRDALLRNCINGKVVVVLERDDWNRAIRMVPFELRGSVYTPHEFSFEGVRVLSENNLDLVKAREEAIIGDFW